MNLARFPLLFVLCLAAANGASTLGLPANFVLKGAITLDKEVMVLVIDTQNNHRSKWLHVGDSFEQWEVLSYSRADGSVELGNASDRVMLSLISAPTKAIQRAAPISLADKLITSSNPDSPILFDISQKLSIGDLLNTVEKIAGTSIQRGHLPNDNVQVTLAGNVTRREAVSALLSLLSSRGVYITVGSTTVRAGSAGK